MIFIKQALAKKVAPAAAPTPGIIELLTMRMGKHENARTHKVVHISMLTREDGFCPREFALLDVTKRTIKDPYVTTAMRAAFDTGNALAGLVRNRWLEHDVVGNWECLGCNSLLQFSKKPKAACPTCERKLWVYREPAFIDGASDSTGSIDFFVDLNSGKLNLVEAKTIDKDEFADLKAPYAEHRIRTQMYLRLIERSGSPHAAKIDTSFGYVLYVSKGYGKKDKESGKITPFKEYTVLPDAQAADALFARGETLRNYRNGGPMPQGICSNSFQPRVKSCTCAKECWNGKYPAGM